MKLTQQKEIYYISHYKRGTHYLFKTGCPDTFKKANELKDDRKSEILYLLEYLCLKCIIVNVSVSQKAHESLIKKLQ